MTDIFRVPMEVTYAIEGGEPALMAYRRWRNISRDDLAVKSGIPRQEIDAGKLLTYAATLDATAIVWIAERFTDEHRKAIDWLNEHTVEDLSLYAVQVELWQIDSSRPALRFSLISQPNEIARQGVAIKSGGAPSQTKQLQKEFWELFRERLLEKRVVVSAQAARPQYWFNVAIGRAHIGLSCVANTWDHRIGVRVYISNKVADWALPQLEVHRAQIEAEIGEHLTWNPYPDKLDKIIVLDRSADLNDRNRWNEYVSWLVDRVDKIRKAFGPRVKGLISPNEPADVTER